MIVNQDLARKLATGRATQLRRPHNMAPLKPQHTYSVMPGHGKPAACRVTVLEAHVTHLGDLTYEDAKAMGHTSTGWAKCAWVRAWDAKWIARELVMLAAAFDDGTVSVVDWILVKRFDEYWAHRLVQVVTVKRVVDEPRYLADQRRANADQYTRTPGRSIDPTAECVDEVYQEALSAKASERDAALRASVQRDLAAEQARRKTERGRSMRLPPYARRAA